MLGDLPACSGFGVGSMIAKYGPNFPFEQCGKVFTDSDIVIGNLEVVLSRFDRKVDPFSSIHLRAQPEAVGGLAWAGINAVTLANNHIMQHGTGAILETIETLRHKNIAYTGIESPELGLQNFAVIEKRGVKVGLLGYNFRPEQYSVSRRIDVAGDSDRIRNDIESVRNLADFIVLSLHWGEEFINRPSSEQVRIGRDLIDCGAHVILGHHPHILQGIEKYRGRIIAYSLGDFVFDLWAERLRKSMILRLELQDPTDIRFGVLPVMINDKWQPVPWEGALGEPLKEEILGLAELINANASEAEWKREVLQELRRFRRSVYIHYLTNLHRFGVKRLSAIAMGVIRNRFKK